MRRLLPAFVLLLSGTLSCFAQTSVLPVFRNPTGSGTTEVSAANPLPVNASVSASISGFHQESVLTPLSVTVANTTSGAFTAAKTIIVANAGSTNTAYCALGNTATTSGQPVPPQSWVAFTSTVETTVSCITASSTTTVNVSVGSGLPTGAGGGAGGSGGGAITAASGSYAAGALSAGAGVDGWDLTQGAKADAACTTDIATCTLIALIKRANQNQSTMIGLMSASVPAGNNLIGKFGIDQTTPGTTNAVAQNGTWTVQPGNTANTTPWLDTVVGADGTTKVTIKPASTPAATTDTALVISARPATPATPIVAAASDNHQVIKNGAGIAFSIHASNNSATANYARLYDAGTGFNGCNSATGAIFAFEIPPSNSGFSISLGGSRGIAFANGLSLCVTSGFGLTDTTNATASAIFMNVSYN